MNAWSQHKRAGSIGLSALVLSIAACALVGAFDLLPSIFAELPIYLDEHAGWLLLLGLLQAAITISRSRRRLKTTLRDSWIAVTPRAALTIRFTIAIGTAWQCCRNACCIYNYSS